MGLREVEEFCSVGESEWAWWVVDVVLREERRKLVHTAL